MSSMAAIIPVVDDDESFRTGLQRLLRAAGHETRIFLSSP
jgi:FixJ family two-component response regulator